MTHYFVGFNLENYIFLLNTFLLYNVAILYYDIKVIRFTLLLTRRAKVYI